MSKEFERFRNTTDFDYLHEELDSSKSIWVVDLTVKFDTVIPGMLGECFLELKEKANRFGANAFQVTGNDIFINGSETPLKISPFLHSWSKKTEIEFYNIKGIWLSANNEHLFLRIGLGQKEVIISETDEALFFPVSAEQVVGHLKLIVTCMN